MITTAIAFPDDEPRPLVTPQQFAEFTEAWLTRRRLRKNTRDAYRRGVKSWVSWNLRWDRNPLDAKFTHVNEYARYMEEVGDIETGRVLKPSTVAQRLTGISSWYRFMVQMGLISGNPCDGVDRPYVDQDYSSSVGMSPLEMDKLLRAAGRHSRRYLAMMCVLADLGLRVSELLDLDIANVRHEQGMHVARFEIKGGDWHVRKLSGDASRAVDDYLAERAAEAGCRVSDLTGPVFVTATGRKLDRQQVYHIVRSLAKKAKIVSWENLSPHSLRHTYVTRLLELGVPLEQVQRSLRHRRPETTLRYWRNKDDLTRDPSDKLAADRAKRSQAS